MLYFRDIATLEKRVYDKPYINDNMVDFSYLTDRENYKVLPSQKYRPFFFKPFYAKPSDFSETVSHKVWLLRIFGSLILLKLGFEFGAWDGKAQTEKLGQSKVIDMETEEEIYYHLYNKDRTAVFLMLYNPGHFLNENFNKVFELESSKPQ